MLQITGLVDGVLPNGQQLIGLEIRSENLLHLPLQPLHPPPGAAAQAVSSKHDVEQSAEDGDDQDGHDPGDLIGRVAPVPQNPQHSQDADRHAQPVKVNEVAVEAQDHHQQHRDLDQDKHRHQNHPVKQQRYQLFHVLPSPPLSGGRHTRAFISAPHSLPPAAPAVPEPGPDGPRRAGSSTGRCPPA